MLSQYPLFAAHLHKAIGYYFLYFLFVFLHSLLSSSQILFIIFPSRLHSLLSAHLHTPIFFIIFPSRLHSLLTFTLQFVIIFSSCSFTHCLPPYTHWLSFSLLVPSLTPHLHTPIGFNFTFSFLHSLLTSTHQLVLSLLVPSLTAQLHTPIGYHFLFVFLHSLFTSIHPLVLIFPSCSSTHCLPPHTHWLSFSLLVPPLTVHLNTPVGYHFPFSFLHSLLTSIHPLVIIFPSRSSTHCNALTYRKQLTGRPNSTPHTS